MHRAQIEDIITTLIPLAIFAWMIWCVAYTDCSGRRRQPPRPPSAPATTAPVAAVYPFSVPGTAARHAGALRLDPGGVYASH